MAMTTRWVIGFFTVSNLLGCVSRNLDSHLESEGSMQDEAGNTEDAGDTEDGGDTDEPFDTEDPADTDEPDTELPGCGLSPTCGDVNLNALWQDPLAEDAQCVMSVLASEVPAIFTGTETIGPTEHVEREIFVLVLGDGMALLQSRMSDCGDNECVGGPFPWGPYEDQKLCEIVPVHPCGVECDDCECSLDPLSDSLRNCESIDPWTCDDVLALLEGE